MVAPRTTAKAKIATIRDVAQKARVSTATVSYVINKSRYVSPELTARVQKVIKELAFTPSRIAQGLRGGKTHTLGLIIDDITNRFASQFIRGLENAASVKHYGIIISDLQEMRENEERSFGMLVARKVDGIIYAGYGQIEKELTELNAQGTPVVAVDKPLAEGLLPSVVVNNRSGVWQSLEHLAGLGISEIVYINGLEINKNALLRAEAFREFMASRRFPLEADSVIFGDFTLEHGYETALRLVRSGRRFRALLCGDDLVAFGAMAALKSCGLRIPEDVAVVGFDDDPMASIFDPSLTTVHYPMFEMGRLSFQTFQRLASSKPRKPTTILIDTRLVVRRSTDSLFRDYHTAVEVALP
jgi:LacI family transcriptional regulator